MLFTVHGNARTLNWWNCQHIVQFNLGQISVDDSTISYKRDEKMLVFSVNFLLLFQKKRSENQKSDQVSRLVHFDMYACLKDKDCCTLRQILSFQIGSPSPSTCIINAQRTRIFREDPSEINGLDSILRVIIKKYLT